MTDVRGRLAGALAGRYRIERELGEGGMATVYLAHDARHDRPVALKVLRPELSAILGAERFLAEIKTTANLQHPHILSLFDSGEADGLVWYAMPYVEGESLRDRLNREHQLPVDEAVRIASEVADALAYAHGHGVIHRDIKPENILLHGGHAQVADFGIALAAARSEGGTRMTETGMSLGTPQYMSPEQAMGEREISPRSDVYALGCVLYEMLVGEPPFTGPTAQAIIARVLTEEPRPLALQRRTVPPHVETAVLVALAKLPADRFATASAFAAALANPAFRATASSSLHAVAARSRGPAPVGAGRLWRVGALGGALVLAALLGAAVRGRARPAPAPTGERVVRFGIQLPRDAESVGATGSTITFSPDGSRIVYVGKSPSGQRLYVRGLDATDPLPIPGTEGAVLPFFSADGRTLGFRQGDRLVKVALGGGPVTPICEAGGTTYGATWTPGDTVIFASPEGLMEVPAAGGAPRVLARPDSGEGFEWPDAVDGGRAVLFTVVGRRGIRLAALARRTREVTRLQQPGGYPQYVDAGYVVLSDPAGTAQAVPFDPHRLAVTGPAVPLIDQIVVNVDGDRNLGISRTGDFAYQSFASAGSRLVLVDRSGTVSDVGTDTGLYAGPRLSPDGGRVAVARLARWTGGEADIWVLDLARHTRTRVTFDSAASSPTWTPDGHRIAYARRVNGATSDVYWTAADGSGTPESLLTAAGLWFPAAFTPDGRELLIHGVAPSQPKAEIRRLAVGGGREALQPVVAAAYHNYNPSLSPDGRWVAYESEETGRFEVYVRSYPGPGGKWQVSLEGGTEPVWSPTGRELFFRSGDRMMAAAVRPGTPFAVGARTRLFDARFDRAPLGLTDYDVTRDGRRFLMLQQVEGTAQSVFVTLNWFAQRRGAGR